MCKIKCSGVKKMFKELPELKSTNDVTKAMNYRIMALTAYKATTEVIFNRVFLDSSSNFHTYKKRSQHFPNETVTGIL